MAGSARMSARGDDPALGDGAAHRALARLEDQLAHDVGVGAVGGQRAQRAVLGLEQEHAGGPRVDQLGGAPREQLGDRLRLQGRRQLAGQPRQHLGHVAPPLGLAVEPRVLDGDGRLGQEQVDQVLLVLAEAQRLGVAERHDREQLVAGHHRVARRSSGAPSARPLAIHEPLVGEHVVAPPAARGGGRPSRRRPARR